MNKNFVIEYFDVVLSMKQKQRRNQQKERDKSKKTKESKKEEKEGRKKRKKERQRKKKWKRGRPKKAMEKERETVKNKQKMPFLGGKTVFFYENKERKGSKKKKTNKEGLGPSEVALRATSPDR